MLIGAHVSPAGGPANAVARGEERGCRSIQIFNQSPRAWRPREYSEEEVAAYHEAMDASKDIGLSQFFVGVFVVAIVGNAAEHWVAVLVATKDKMDLAVNIAIGSSAQIALFAAPVLVICSFFLGPHPMALVFNGFEVGAVILAVLIANHVTNEGESTWFEGLQLLAVYIVLGMVFFFV